MALFDGLFGALSAGQRCRVHPEHWGPATEELVALPMGANRVQMVHRSDLPLMLALRASDLAEKTKGLDFMDAQAVAMGLPTRAESEARARQQRLEARRAERRLARRIARNVKR